MTSARLLIAAVRGCLRQNTSLHVLYGHFALKAEGRRDAHRLIRGVAYGHAGSARSHQTVAAQRFVHPIAKHAFVGGAQRAHVGCRIERWQIARATTGVRSARAATTGVRSARAATIGARSARAATTGARSARAATATADGLRPRSSAARAGARAATERRKKCYAGDHPDKPAHAPSVARESHARQAGGSVSEETRRIDDGRSCQHLQLELRRVCCETTATES